MASESAVCHPREMTSMATPSVFRSLMTQLNGTKGRTPHWPIVLRRLLLSEYRRPSGLMPYKSDVAKIRDKVSWDKLNDIRVAEVRDVLRLFLTCRDESGSVLTIGSDRYLLLGWQWPNQGSARGRRADLVGLNKEGGIVVFEAKGPKNGNSPMMATLEGLDYLVHLTLVDNLKKIAAFYSERFGAPATGKKELPRLFKDTRPTLSACHEVVVIAPASYYAMHSRSGKKSGRGHGWKEFAGSVTDGDVALRFSFAQTNFNSTACEPLTASRAGA